MDPLRGRRLPDQKFTEFPKDIQPGDYWKCTDIDLGDNYPENRTRTVWRYASPDGNGLGLLMQHTVRENDDGTITIAPGDGSSNSVLHSGGGQGKVWHGYVDHGVWKPV